MLDELKQTANQLKRPPPNDRRPPSRDREDLCERNARIVAEVESIADRHGLTLTQFLEFEANEEPH